MSLRLCKLSTCSTRTRHPFFPTFTQIVNLTHSSAPDLQLQWTRQQQHARDLHVILAVHLPAAQPCHCLHSTAPAKQSG